MENIAAETVEDGGGLCVFDFSIHNTNAWIIPVYHFSWVFSKRGISYYKYTMDKAAGIRNIDKIWHFFYKQEIMCITECKLS